MRSLAGIFAALLLVAVPVTGLADDKAEGPADRLFIVHFSTGPAWNEDLPPGEQPGFAEHSANLNRLRSDGAIAFGARYEDLGVLLIRAATPQALSDLLNEDPGVRSGIFTFRAAALSVFYPWQDAMPSRD